LLERVYDLGMVLAEAMAQLEAALDALAEVDLAGAGDQEVARHAVAVHAAGARLSALQAHAVAAADARLVWGSDGSKSCAAWLATHRRADRSRCTTVVRLGRALRSMAETDAALTAGHISVEHAAELARCHRFAPAEFAGYEAALVGHARRLDWPDFVRVCAAWRDAVDATKAEKDGDRLHERRHLVVHRRPDGSLSIQSGSLDPVGGEAFLSELEAIERELFDEDLAAAKEEHGDDVPLSKLARSATQRRADALVEMAHRSRTAPADGQRPEPLVSVYVGYDTVAGRLCELASGTPITAKQLLPIFTRADIERAVFAPGNRVIEVGLRSRFFTGGLRRGIELRDRHCQHPGCDVPAARCHVDHIVDHGRGGYTTQDNGRLLCAAHNLARNRRRPGTALVDPVTGEEVEHPDDVAEAVARVRQRLLDLTLARTAA